jgi:transketolase
VLTEEKLDSLKKLATLVRYYSLVITTNAGSGHPTSSLSAADLMVGLMFGGEFHYDVDDPDHPNNDGLIFSKGHASPLFYSLWLAAGKVSEQEIMTYRQFGSRLQGHPTVSFPYTEAATGSLGQGLSIGVGLALNARYLDDLTYRTYVLLGDSEMAEGSQWEAMQIAAYYRLGNLIGILDVNRLGQRGETMYGHDLGAYQQRIAAFGWNTILVDGHSLPEILDAFELARRVEDKPTMIIAWTIKGKGVREVEDKNGWHGKPLDRELLKRAIEGLGEINISVRGQIPKPEDRRPRPIFSSEAQPMDYQDETSVATRTAYGNALKRLAPKYPSVIGLDGEVSNSTRADRFAKAFPERFFEMYIAEQNMAGVALGLSCRGKIPFASTFSAFWSRAFDQIRMSQYSDANIKFVGSHAGVSIGEDGPSQMGLEDVAIFRALRDSVVLEPCDAVSTEKLVEEMCRYSGIVYLRTMRQKSPKIYDRRDEFKIGGSKVLRSSGKDFVAIVCAGVTVHEALAAYEDLARQKVPVRVIDLYSIKPLDEATLKTAAAETQAIITVEDHYPFGGLGEAVAGALAGVACPIHSLAVREKPQSGSGEELRDYEAISSGAIVEKVLEIAESTQLRTRHGKPGR